MTGRVVGLFAGVGGIEKGLQEAGFEGVHLNEIDDKARAVLARQFPEADLSEDVRAVGSLPEADVLSAGFPCTDISQAGRKVGIRGAQSGLVDEIFKLVSLAQRKPAYIVMENVSYLLNLGRGAGMRHVLDGLEALGYRWAYRVVDARAFGLPQRRQRVVFVASLNDDPRNVLFADDAPDAEYVDNIGPVDESVLYGFYWTEGLRGLGWARDAVPTIKGGSGLGIPSPPAIWDPGTGEVGTLHIEDAERLQGFPAGWTIPDQEEPPKDGVRWRQIGNAVCVPMTAWIGSRLNSPGDVVAGDWDQEWNGGTWPSAAFGQGGKVYRAPVSRSPFRNDYSLRSSLMHPLKPLSYRATTGFLSRARRSKLRFSDGFLPALDEHVLRFN
ncbi:DNA cytosine methyltransferase [Kocuria rosea]|uniref:DNA cytosine methyltransferase n=1 Tax=Kocuria rosea TaxID=1275 RepID=UPI000DFC9F10|nr:DNA (cytosine-5-)-methyltransferase [Kocuria rosea]STX07151.1 Modification methylase HhaI [Kocuria rosea]